MSTSENPTPPPTPPPSISAAARPACAACKHQRRRCSPDCALAPYFPADKQREFRNVHRLFGINNVVKLLKKLPPHHHEDAVASVIHEANFRAADPAGGAYAVVQELRRRIDRCNAELKIVSENLAFHRSRSMRNFNGYDHLDSKPLIFKNNQESAFRIQEMDNSEIVHLYLNDKPSFTDN